jgi:hypothetical protein
VRRLSKTEVDELALALGLQLGEVDVCHACLSFVSFSLDQGDERAASGWARRMAPDLWDEGLALPIQAALQRARNRGVPGAAEAIAEVGERGPRARIVAAVVRRLAEQQVAEMRSNRIGGRNGRVTLLP